MISSQWNKYHFNEIDKFIESIGPLETVRKNKVEYFNVPVAFDIETSSFYENNVNDPNNKRGIMYAWVLGINGNSILGRTWEELEILIERITEEYELFSHRKMLVYVHNLSYDFQFFRKHFNINKIFALTEREPLRAVDDEAGLEFRCSYKLSGYSLAKVGEHLTTYKVNKMVGDLDYSLVRTPVTPLTEKEENYIYFDSFVVMAYIQEEIEKAHNNITRIPLTKTGKVRNYCRDYCYKKDGKRDKITFFKYRHIMEKLHIESELEYLQLKQAFMGGFTHANHKNANKILNDVSSFDFSSSYPAVMVAERFPMSKGERVKITSKEEFRKYLNLYCCIFKITFYNIVETFTYDHYISVSKCIDHEDIIQDNGRVVRATKISLYLTNVDFEIIEKTYKWDKIEVSNFRAYMRDYLPTNFVKSILNLYAKKTELKGVEGKEIEYQESKENVNGCYGMTVTDICRDDITYQGDEWGHNEVDKKEKLNRYNKDIRRFLYYPWGIFVTAYARKNLWSGILELKEDYIYSDTDSLKFMNYEKHKEYFDRYNRIEVDKLEKALKRHNLAFNYIYPKTIEGKTKTLGVWDYEGKYDYFKTLGAKRYAYIKGEDIKLVVSGIKRDDALPYLKSKYGSNLKVMNNFKEGMYIAKGYTGKQIHTYIDFETSGNVIDYLGKDYNYKELSSIHLEDADYHLSMTDDYIKYLMGIIVTTESL